jgi:hypothetical protein
MPLGRKRDVSEVQMEPVKQVQKLMHPDVEVVKNVSEFDQGNE